MRIGVVSDTHNNLKNVRRIVELFNDAGVERVIHTGDITQPKTIEMFSSLEAPMWGVFGNNDQGELSSLDTVVRDLGFDFVQPPLPLEWANRRIVVVHDPLELSMVEPSEFDLVLHGHTHLFRHEDAGTHVIFNPGECAGMMAGANAIGVVDLAQMKPEIIRF